MQQRYFAISPYNLAHIIRGATHPEDSGQENVYTRAARYFQEWIHSGILVQDPEPGIYAYFQRFCSPEDRQTYVRKGFIALGAVEDYSAGIVYRHELTHSGPKRDRLELLRRTRAHFGQIFMLYDDPEAAVDRLLDRAAEYEPELRVTDEYGAEHTLWGIRDRETVAVIQRLMEPRKLLIADGHHRYETALAFRNENPDLPGADKVMMTFVNMRSPGLVILPTHRVVTNLPDFQVTRMLRQAKAFFEVDELPSLEALQKRLARAEPGQTVIGGIFQGDPRFFAFEADNQHIDNLLPELAPAERRLDVVVLHQVFLSRVLGLTDEAVRDERNIRYIRGYQAAADEIRRPGAQAVFLLNPVRAGQVAEVAFGGGVMPQKSTDFYPKLLSGVTIYKLE